MELRLPLGGHFRARAVDREGEGLESFASKTRDKAAALWFIKRSMKPHGKARAVVTDGLRSYGAAMNEIGNASLSETGRWLNNRAENSHQPFRRRERAMLRFRTMKTLQTFSSVHAALHNHSMRCAEAVARRPRLAAPPCRLRRYKLALETATRWLWTTSTTTRSCTGQGRGIPRSKWLVPEPGRDHQPGLYSPTADRPSPVPADLLSKPEKSWR